MGMFDIPYRNGDGVMDILDLLFKLFLAFCLLSILVLGD